MGFLELTTVILPIEEQLRRREEAAYTRLIAALRVIEALTLRELRGETVAGLYPAAVRNLARQREDWMSAARAHRDAIARRWLEEDAAEALGIAA
jgi:predicted urease superfamily metal-dependent hydrolase